MDVRCVRRWRAQEESLNAQVTDGNKKKLRLDGGGRKPLDADMEEMLFQWNQWLRNQLVVCLELREKE